MSDLNRPPFKLCAKNRVLSSYNTLSIMQRHSELCDVYFMFNEKLILAHKIVLTTHSHCFKEMFTGPEGYNKCFKFINDEFTCNAFELLIQFMYGKPLIINESNVQELLIGSNFICMDDVKNECLKYIEQTINIENCMITRRTADVNKITELRKLFLSFVLKNYKNVVKSDIFLSFPFELMMELIQSDDLCAAEEEIYESTMIWLKHKVKERLKYLPELIKLIRFNLIPIDFLNCTVKEEDLIKSNVTCMGYLTNAYEVHAQMQQQNKSMDNEFTRRKFTQISLKYDYTTSIKHFLIIKDSPEFMSFEFQQIMELIKSDDLCAEEIQVFKATISWVKYDEKNRSKLFPKLFLLIRLPLIQLRDLINIVEVEDLVVSNAICKNFLQNTFRTLLLHKNNLIDISICNIFNYRNKDSKQVIVLYRESGVSKIEWFDSTKKVFYQCSLTFPSDVTTSNLILRDGRIFSISRSDGCNSVKLYDGDLNTWKSISTPIFVHVYSNIVQFYDHIYLMSTSGIEYYDIINETWHEAKLKITGVKYLKLAVVSDLIYGISVNNSKAFYYNPKTDSGQFISSVPAGIFQYSICSLNDQLYFIGGHIGRGHKKNCSIYKYDSQTNSWDSIYNNSTCFFKPGVVVLNGKLCLIGGDNCRKSQCYSLQTKKFKWMGGHLQSSEHSYTQAFLIDTKCITPNNTLNYYSINEI